MTYEEAKSTFMINESYCPLLNAMRQIKSIMDEAGIPFVFVGGSTLPFYGYYRNTGDIDIVVADSDSKKLDDLPIGMIRRIRRGKMMLHSPGTNIDVIFSGGVVGSDKSGMRYPDPKELIEMKVIDGTPLPILPLKRLVQIKIVSGIYGMRMKDFADVIELIKENQLPETYCNEYNFDIRDKYRELFEMTKRQIECELKFGH